MYESQLKEQVRTNPGSEQADGLAHEAWTARACVYTDEANGVVAGWKDSENKPTWEKIVSSQSNGSSQTTDFRGKDGKHYQVTEFDTDLIVKPELRLQLKQPGSNFSHSEQQNNALKEYLSFKDELENGKICNELAFSKDNNKGIHETAKEDSVEETAVTRISRTADGQKVIIQAMNNGRETGRAEYSLARDREGNEVCIFQSQFPDGYRSRRELSAEDFYAIRDSKGQTWKWIGDPKNHKFYIQG